MFLVLKKLKLNPALTLGLGFLEAFLLRLRRAWEGLSILVQLWFQIHIACVYNGFTSNACVYNGVQWFHNSHTCVYNGVFAVVCKVHNLQLLANTLQQQNGNACANFTMSILLVSVCNSQYSQHTFEEWHVQISQCQARFLSIPLFSSFRRVGTSQLWLEFHILALPC